MFDGFGWADHTSVLHQGGSGDHDTSLTHDDEPRASKTQRPAGFGAFLVPPCDWHASHTCDACFAPGPVVSTLAGIGDANDDVANGEVSPSAAVIAAARAGDTAGLHRALAALSPAALSRIASPGGVTPLMWAADGGHAAAARVLLDAGADACARDDGGDTALDYATGCGHAAVADILREQLVQRNTCDEQHAGE